MSEEQRPSAIQINLASGQRNAYRDYVEHHEIHVPDSIKIYLAVTPSERLDREAIDNERLFIYRFGFDAAPTAREQVIALKRQYGLTDREIRGLRFGGNLMVRREDVKFSADPWMMWSGWIQLGIFSLLLIDCVFQISFSSVPAWRQTLGLITLMAVWFVIAIGLNKLYIAPWRLLRKVGAV
jgi:hypothetical protein